MPEEMVNHPRHYNSHPSGVECIDVIEWFTLNVGTCIKHLWRAGLKDNNPMLQDLEKAAFYLNREVERVKKMDSKKRGDTLVYPKEQR